MTRAAYPPPCESCVRVADRAAMDKRVRADAILPQAADFGLTHPHIRPSLTQQRFQAVRGGLLEIGSLGKYDVGINTLGGIVER
jgi:hypothetical protein